MPTRSIVISASSDIGLALCNHMLTARHEVFGTYRKHSASLVRLEGRGAKLAHCELSNTKSIDNALNHLISICPNWDQLILCPGSQEPVGKFTQCDFDQWEESILINFTAQMRCVHKLMKTRNLHAPKGPLVLFFAGGGTNNATTNYSAYTLSKIALIKACELLHAEEAGSRFVILGPGWVKTKIHMSTISAGPELAGGNYTRTIDKLASDECNPMSRVIECCDWVLGSDREIVSGRNFSVVFDSWGEPKLDEILLNDNNMYKLRRYGNDFDARI